MGTKFYGLSELNDPRFVQAAKHSKKFTFNYFVMIAAETFASDFYNHIVKMDRSDAASENFHYSDCIFAEIDTSEGKFKCNRIYVGENVYFFPQEELESIETPEDFMGVMYAIYESAYTSLLIYQAKLGQNYNFKLDINGGIKKITKCGIDFCYIYFTYKYLELNTNYITP